MADPVFRYVLAGVRDAFERTLELAEREERAMVEAVERGRLHVTPHVARIAGEEVGARPALQQAREAKRLEYAERSAKGEYNVTQMQANMRHLDRMKTLVLTSATLTADGSFDYLRGRLGVRRAVEVRLDSEFDYASQAILYLPKNMPDPRSPQFAAAAGREVIEILRRTDGRASGSDSRSRPRRA